MTTEAAARLYEAMHVFAHDGLQPAVVNPYGKRLEDLPVIYGFNNGGPPGWMSAVLLAEDGECLGGHCCSSEAYMPADLGILEGTRPDRHETFRSHYPDGYRMEFIPGHLVRDHAGLALAIDRNKQKEQK